VWDGQSTKNNEVHGGPPTPQQWDQNVEEIWNIQKWLLGDNGAQGVAGSNVAKTEGGVVLHETTLTLSGTLVLTDAGAAGTHGSRKILDFPLGVLKIYSVKTDVHIVSNAAGLTATAAVVAALGTAAVSTDNATLSGTEADIVASTAATLTGSAGDFDNVSNGETWDGRSTAKDCYLNFAAPDGDSTADDTLTLSGTVTIVWSAID
jgi:hypothetical protein